MLKNTILLLILFGTALVNAQDIDNFLEKANVFFSSNIENGLVDYASIQKTEELNELVAFIELTNYKSLETKKQKSYLINVYNLLVIKQIVQHYPTSSPMNINGFFEVNKHKIGTEELTLNELENDFMRPTYKDPRLHFVLVCGAKGCPPIINKAYLPATLEEQLEQQTKIAMNNPKFIKTSNNEVMISEIFKWYASDFTKTGKSVVEYINSYRTTPIPSNKYGYYAYDWSINHTISITINHEEPASHPSNSFNLQTYNAGSLLKLGKFDVSLFNALYTQKKSQWMGQTFEGFRESFYSSLLQVTFGVSKNARINLGADFKFATSGRRNTNDAFSGVGQAFTFQNNDSSRVGLSYVGPRIKIQPFKNETNFTVQSSLLFPTTVNTEGRSDNPDTQSSEALYFLDWNRIQSWTQFFYVKDFNKSQLFLEGDLWYRIGYQENQASALDIPFTAIYSYFPTSTLTFYALASQTTRHQLNPNNFNDAITTAAEFTSVGLGMKYQLSPKLNLEVLYTKFLRGTNSGLGNTFNLGIRYVH